MKLIMEPILMIVIVGGFSPKALWVLSPMLYIKSTAISAYHVFCVHIQFESRAEGSDKKKNKQEKDVHAQVITVVTKSVTWNIHVTLCAIYVSEQGTVIQTKECSGFHWPWTSGCCFL